MGDPKEELNTTLDYLLEISNSSPEELQKNIYDSVSGLSFLALEAKKANFNPGWAATLKDRVGNPMFNPDESNIVESISSFIKPIFDDDPSQEGGAFTMPKMPQMPQIPKMSVTLGDNTFSLDQTYWKVKEYIDGLDAQASQLAKDYGPFQMFYDKKTDYMVNVPLPFPPYTILVPINPAVIPVLIQAVVEIIRLFFTVGSLSNDTARKLMSIVVAIIDLLKGKWKHSILSIIGYFGRDPLIIGIMGKVFLDAFTVIAPRLQDKTLLSLFQSSKSFVVGICLWAFSTFAPAIERLPVIKVIQDLKINHPGLIDDVTINNFHDMQKFVNQPQKLCNVAFKNTITTLKKSYPLRLALELLNIPTDPNSEKEYCESAGLPVAPSIPAIPSIPEVSSTNPFVNPPPSPNPFLTPDIPVATPVAAPVATPVKPKRSWFGAKKGGTRRKYRKYMKLK